MLVGIGKAAHIPCCLLQDLQFIEFYAGYARTSLVMKASGLRTAKCDIKYFFGKEGRNFYDILTNAGFAFWPRQC